MVEDKQTLTISHDSVGWLGLWADLTGAGWTSLGWSGASCRKLASSCSHGVKPSQQQERTSWKPRHTPLIRASHMAQPRPKQVETEPPLQMPLVVTEQGVGAKGPGRV